MKKFVSKLLILTLVINLSASLFIPSYALEKKTTVINEQINPDTGYTTQLSYWDSTYYYFTETNDKILSASFKLTGNADIYIKDKKTDSLYNRQIKSAGTTTQIISDITSYLNNNYDGFVLSEVGQYKSTQVITRSANDSKVSSLMIAKHGSPYNGKLLVRQSGPNSSYGELTESLTYWVGDRSDMYIAIGASLAGAAATLGLPTATVAKLLSSYIVSGTIVKAVGVQMYHSEAQWTKTVYVNNTYQYYAGKDMKYAVAFVDSLNSGLVSRGSYTHPDYNNNSLLMQKGFNNYFA